MAELKNDMTPFQIGSFGHFKDNFVFIGRVQISWADGFWNEWYIRFDDGKEAWLAEAQGSYMISFAADIPKTLPKATELSPEMPIQIGSILYQVDDIKDVTYAFAEGELPFSAPQGFKGVSVDLSHGENYFASISYTESGDVDVFVGQYLEFEKFQFKNLRQIDGW